MSMVRSSAGQLVGMAVWERYYAEYTRHQEHHCAYRATRHPDTSGDPRRGLCPSTPLPSSTVNLKKMAWNRLPTQCRGRIIAPVGSPAECPATAGCVSLLAQLCGTRQSLSGALGRDARLAERRLEDQPAIATLRYADEVIAYCQQLSPIVTTSNTTLTA